jgi:N-acetylglucosaminyldiphosphoundecaprenol N-acetyl-beta-D-mannosaminyltransferase
MPLVWCLNLQGAAMRDRVYGPTFFRECLLKTPSPFKHYLLGGSPECGEKLRQQIAKWNPAIEIVGAYHGWSDLDGHLEGDADEKVINEINILSPDFIWVGLGTPKQYGWIDRNKMKINRGILLAVGFAFDVNAGTKKDAPPWMQKAGLTWLFRLSSEPRRLASRYFRYNSLFLFYLIWDGLRDRVFRSTFHRKTLGRNQQKH